jgi:hypothetical protein
MRNTDLVYKTILCKPQTNQEVCQSLDGLLTQIEVNQAINNLKRKNLVKIIGKVTEQAKNTTSRRNIGIYEALPMPEVTPRTERHRRRNVDLSKKRPLTVFKQLMIETNPQFMLYSKELGLNHG